MCMRLKKWTAMLLCAMMAVTCIPVSSVQEVKAAESSDREVLNFDTEWLYSSVDYENGASVDLDDSGFEQVSVPHANTILQEHKGEDFEKEIASYRFVSWYRRHFTLPKEYAGRNIMVEFEGVATVAQVYLNGELLAEHDGAYTGFTVDISDYVYTDGRDNVLAVRVDSEKQTQIPPEGGNVDYCVFGGIVRDVSMTITDPVFVERTFVTTPGLEEGNGVVNTQVDIKNTLTQDKTYTIETAVKDADGKVVKTASVKEKLAAGEETTVTVETDKIIEPHLWDVDDPYLYTLVTTIKDGNTVIDTYDTSFGMRYFEFKSEADDRSFYLNGQKLEIIGINRHEQWPWIGRAVPDKLQEQDADLIKANGINAVRCSHYPQDPAFMNRCDEIGLLVFTEPPGWQHVGDSDWQEIFKENLRELIFRDRNHPSVISWGVVPNESEAGTEEIQRFNQECQQIAKELDPTRPTHGVRWEFFFDNHVKNGKLEDIATDLLTVNYRYPGMNNNKDENLLSTFSNPYLVTEHSNECWFNGGGVQGTSDTLMLQFVDSFMKYVDYFYGNDMVAGGFGWSMFDYNNEVNYTNTGHVFYSGLYDIFRHEKPVAWAYRTQQDAEDVGAMVYIANHWTKDTSSTVYVFSNCDEVELFVNGVSKGRITPNKYTNLPHPIYEFGNIAYEEGELKAVGYIDGEVAEECIRTTPGEAVALVAEADYSTLTADGTDMTSVSVTAVDENGNEVPFADNVINVVQKSGVETTLISEKDVKLEGGKITFLVQSVYGKTGTAEFEVVSDGLESASCSIKIDAFTADNLVPASSGNGYEEPKLPEQYNINDTKAGNGLYQFDYQGTGWEYGSETTAYNGDNHWTNVAGDICEIRFIGPNIQYYGAKAPAHGIVAFSIDGGEEVMVDCYTASRQGSVLLFDSGLLEDGEHVLTVRLTGEKNVSATGNYMNADKVLIDFNYTAPKKVVNDADTGTGEFQINYEGRVWDTTETAGCYLGDEKWSDIPDEYLTFTFTGTSVKYYASVASHHGIGAFSIDGGEEVMVDFYSATRQNQVLLFDSGQLENGEHVLKVRVTGTKPITVDMIEVYEESPVNKADLVKAIENAVQASDKDKYTDESWSIYEKALAAAVKINDKEDATQREVDKVLQTLTDAQAALEEKPDDRPLVRDIFEDVREGDWYEDAVQYVYDNTIMTGLNDTKFGSNDTLARAQFAVILYRMNEEPEVEYKATFPDVADNLWYTDAILWASSINVVTGYTDTGLFGPADKINREQMAVMMYRYAKYKGYDTSKKAEFSNFRDASSVSAYAKEAMQWAVGSGIISGKNNGTQLDPQGNATRAECATIIQRFIKTVGN